MYDPFKDLRAKNKVTLARYDRGVITRTECELALAEAAVDLLSATLAEAKVPTASDTLGKMRRDTSHAQAVAAVRVEKAARVMAQTQDDIDRITAEIHRGGCCECCGAKDEYSLPLHKRHCSYTKAILAYVRLEQGDHTTIARDTKALERFHDRYMAVEVVENPMVAPIPVDPQFSERKRKAKKIDTTTVRVEA